MYIDHEEMFLATRNALNFYSKYFGYNYPFSKCDQVFDPSHKYDGLSSQGIISYSEKFIYNEEAHTTFENYKLTDHRKITFLMTVLHELAHQWFGNIITPKWWDDLWIIEAYATFMSFEALEAQGQLKYSKDQKWVKFMDWKKWAMDIDEKEEESHPVRFEASNAFDVRTNIDGITYGKSSSFLKQL